MSLGSFWARTDNQTIKKFSPKSISINGHQFGFLSNIEITQSFENDTGKDINEAVYLLPTYNMLCIFGLTFLIGEKKIDTIIKKTENTSQTTAENKQNAHNMTHFNICHFPKDQTIKVILNISLMSQLSSSNTIITKLPLFESDINVDFDITEFSQIRRVNVNCDDYHFDSKQNKLTIQSATFTNFIFILEIELSEKIQSQMVKYEKVTALSIVPDFLSKTKSSTNKEFIFLIDCSESMFGESFEKAREALNFFISHIPNKSLFNIIKFGETYEKMFTESVCANNVNKNKAQKEISKIYSNLITTEMVQLFEELFESNPLKKRDIFIITDGIVNKQEEIVRMIKINKEFIRIFALGVGKENNYEFLDEIAEITNGKSIFVYKNEDIQKKVSELLDLSLTSVSKNAEIQIEGEKEIQISSLLPNNVKHVFIRKSQEITNDISIHSENYEEKIVNVMRLPFDLNKKNPILALFAHKQLRSVDEISQDEAIHLSLESGVLCKYTDYVDDSSNDFQNCFLNNDFDKIMRNFSENKEVLDRNLRLASGRSGNNEDVIHDSSNIDDEEVISERPTLLQKLSSFASHLRFWEKH